jgi:hypothetical protein
VTAMSLQVGGWGPVWLPRSPAAAVKSCRRGWNLHPPCMLLFMTCAGFAGVAASAYCNRTVAEVKP